MHIEEHKSLKKHNTFAIDCSARYFASIQSISDLKKVLKSKIHSKIFKLHRAIGNTWLYGSG